MHKVRIRLYIAVSLDGYIADRDGGVEWLEPFQDQDYGYEGFLEEISVVVMGRRTWDQAHSLSSDPYPGKRVVVLTGRKLPDAPDGVEAWQGTLAALCARLRDGTPGDVWVVGGADVVDQFMGADELDEIELYVMPLLLGSGVPLFRDTAEPRPLRLVDTREFPTGVVQMRYERPR